MRLNVRPVSESQKNQIGHTYLSLLTRESGVIPEHT